MRRSLIVASLLVAAVAALSACTPSEPVKPISNTPATNGASPTQTTPVSSPVASPVATDGKPVAGKADTLVGQWPGVEGTFLKVEKKGEKFDIEIKNLDGSKKFEGTAKGDVIEFTRNGKTETIKTASAEETGMKWLKGEKNCVVITKGSEGYCKN
jgi:hypothetical protein